MKTCKSGCGGKMKAGGSVKKIKKMEKGGSTGIVGMPRYSNNPRSEQGRILKYGGTTKKLSKAQTGAEVDLDAPPFKTKSSKIGVGLIGSGIVGTAAKAISDKVKANKAKKKEQKKKAAETPKAKFGSSVSVKASCKGGMVRDANGNCVMQRKMAKGGFPDLTGDGKVTKADILKGRGVIKKKGGSVKKYQDGGSKSKNAALEYDKQMLAKQQAENMKIRSKEIGAKGRQEYKAKINQTRNNRANTDALNEMYPNYQGQKKKGGSVKKK